MFNFLKKTVTKKDIILHEIKTFKASKERKMMQDGVNYFKGEHDILKRKRTAIGRDGELVEVTNLPNNRIKDNGYKQMVLQKTNYLLGRPLSITSESDAHTKELKKVFNRDFLNKLNAVGEDSLNCGFGLLFVHYDERGKLGFKRFKPQDVILGWQDEEHTKLDYAIRLHYMQHFDGQRETTVEFVDVYSKEGIDYYELKDNELIGVEPYHAPYFSVVNGEQDTAYNWDEIPIVAFKYNHDEIPLIKDLKSIQDAINTITSNFQNAMEEDTRNTIIVLVNYAGQDLGEFRQNLATYGAVKVRDFDGGKGDVKTLQIEVNAENYKAILSIFKKDLVRNAMGYDPDDERLTGNPNQSNIRSVFHGIDTDANRMERQYQAAFEKTLFFVNSYLVQTGKGDFFDEEVKVIFDRDMLVNESEVIDCCIKSAATLSKETVVANHPWIDDPQAELERIEKEKQTELEQYGLLGSEVAHVKREKQGLLEE